MQHGAGVTRKSRRTRTRRTRTRRTRRTRPKLIARPLGYERTQTRNARTQNMRNRIMASAVLGEGATQQQIRNYAAKLRANRNHAKTMYRSMRRTKRHETKTQYLIDFDKDLQIAIRIFNEDYLPAAPDQETVEQYHYAIQKLNKLNKKMDYIARKVLKGEIPKTDDIRALRSKLARIFESVGADISDIENAKTEDRFNVRGLLNALLE